eukprot:CAMPEP_0194594824 /NCGR_PEP_ID=MMETSP0292-20121207/24541_1 /TAXON_ID=39354 /ORGANISM="Heterosigma akashiwo, Strain CCMP2393" /LENGTH=63 /DNA_ID=CAMNT_0039454463 /DNA_START=73 /DNA_END=264 /DNA_ORIENTATION=-
MAAWLITVSGSSGRHLSSSPLQAASSSCSYLTAACSASMRSRYCGESCTRPAARSASGYMPAF